ncbi:MAG: threonine/serine exporter family protein, partial [Staphylococcus epidermidis]|nr:threonine/serine exporter family protein [Staphylococcus epidermidis]
LVDIITAVLAGTIGYLVVEILDRKLHAQFIPEFIGSLVIGIISVIGHAFVPSGDLATIIIAAVMPIVPGVLITNAIQDLFGGHMLMFTTKSLEALVTAFGIGAGVSSILILV